MKTTTNTSAAVEYCADCGWTGPHTGNTSCPKCGHISVRHGATPAAGEARHTKGPWKIVHTPTRKETFWAICTSSEAPEQAVICLVDGKSKLHQERPELAEANAALIARAPELLAENAVLLAERDRLREVMTRVMQLAELAETPNQSRIATLKIVDICRAALAEGGGK